MYKKNETFFLYTIPRIQMDDANIFALYSHTHAPDAIVQPARIGDDTVPCTFQRRVYIRAGQECPICQEPIHRKSDARLLACGHGFHTECIFKAYAQKMYIKWNSVFRCPMCRQSAHVMYTDVGLRYNPNASEYNGLDDLENFWNHLSTRLHTACPNGYNHALGTMPHCNECRLPPRCVYMDE